MYHENLFDGSAPVLPTGETELREYLASNSDALSHAAALLAGRRGARIINAIRDGLGQPGQLTRHMRRLLLDLRDVLFLDHAHDEYWEDAGCFALLEPDDPAVPEICLLADGLEDALRKAGLSRSEPRWAV